MSDSKSIYDLLQETEARLLHGEWPDFLRTVGRNYKYDFPSQVLIYAQNPDATACADMDTWNTKLKRQVRENAVGITLLRDAGDHLTLRQVFDVSDTFSPLNLDLSLWQLTPEKESAVREALSSVFSADTANQNTDAPTSFYLAISGAILKDSLSELEKQTKTLISRERSLQALPSSDVLKHMQYLILYSMTAAIMHRCDLQPDLPQDAFRHLTLFHTPESLALVGCTVQKYTKQCLEIVSRTVRAWDIRQEKERAEHETSEVSENRSLFHPQAPLTGRAQVEQVRHAAQNLPQGSGTSPIQQSSDPGPSFIPSQQGRGGDRTPSAKGDPGTASAVSGAGQTPLPGGVGGAHANAADESRRTDIPADDLSEGRIESSTLRTPEAQESAILSSLQSIEYSQEDLESVLLGDLGGQISQEKRAQVFQTISTAAIPADAIRTLYGDFSTQHRFPDGKTGTVTASNSGLSFKKGEQLYTFTWSEIAKYSMQIHADFNVSSEPELYTPDLAKLQPGQRLSLPFGGTYTILSVEKGSVTLQDSQNPLFTKEMPLRLLETVLQNQKSDKFHKADKLYSEFSESYNKNAVIIGTVKDDTYTAKPANSAQNNDRKALSVPFEREISGLFSQHSAAETNYRFVMSYAPEVLTGTLDSLIFESETFDPLQIKRLSGNRLSIAHLRKDGENLPSDPEVTFQIDGSFKRLYPLSYKQSQAGYHTQVLSEGEDGLFAADHHQEQEINAFCALWLENLRVQDHTPRLGIKYQDENQLEYRFTADRELVLHEKNDLEPIKKSVMTQPTSGTSENRSIRAFSEPASSAAPSGAPSVPLQPLNYHISDLHMHYGGPKARFAQNLAAIRLLKQLEEDKRMATSAEQAILHRYVGWGGLSQAFDPNDPQWRTEYLALRELLTDEEYASARESTLTAFYTPPVVIDAIYHGLERLGFRQGNLLDPCCGTGHFFGMLPAGMRDMRLHGVELDTLSGRIARQLYQQANIAITGYEQIQLPDSLYDVAVGNVPFGNYSLPDRRYDKEHFLIHDYFIAKTLDKLRPGGVLALLTSYGTLDKQNDHVRRYIAERADLLGAIRLPEGIFRENAGTDAGADLLFLKKRDRPIITDPEWLQVDRTYLPKTKTFIPRLNQYFIQHPDMVLGDLQEVSGPFGKALRCIQREGEDLGKALNRAVDSITQVQLMPPKLPDDPGLPEREGIPAHPDVRNYSYTVLEDGSIYFREDSVMYRITPGKTQENRIRGMVKLRDITRKLIDAQLKDASAQVISDLQAQLNTAYDAYTKTYGLLNSLGNSRAFSDDASYYLLCSLEHIDDKGNFLGKADIFHKRTIGARTQALHCDTAYEALAISMGEKGKPDLNYMQRLCQRSVPQILSDLNGILYPVPQAEGEYELSSTYLSGNIREKLKQAQAAAKDDPRFFANVQALEDVLPPSLPPDLISARLGSPWIPAEDVTQFMYELLSPDQAYQDHKLIRVVHAEYNNSWSILRRTWDKNNVRASSTYGTSQADAYKLLEDALNGRDTQVYTKPDGSEHAVLDVPATLAAQEKQRIIKERFVKWLWSDPDRRDRLCRLYNERFRSVVPPQYDGNLVRFHGMNPNITLEDHQKESVARILYGGNTLLAHAVGAGKTWTMTAAAMESKYLGLCSKTMIVVPNHLVGQWAAAIYTLYPSANVLASTEKDFEMANRRKFCSRIATGDYDIIVIGHSQFEKIPLSKERQAANIQQQIADVIDYIKQLKEDQAEKFTIKQMEQAKRSLQTRLHKLLHSKKRDDVVTFEELGIDRLFIDESHEFKNLFFYTKMHHVAGIAQTDAQKASDLYLKCRYMDERTGNRGNIHATGTPVSNTMAELYTQQRYLQHDLLKSMGLSCFDAWSATFGETVQALELAPEGKGLRQRTRFARFYNVPELMNLYKLTADIRTNEVLNLPIPDARYHTVSVPPSDYQKAYIEQLCARASDIRNGRVHQKDDNMLWITNDGRKAALDQRLIDPSLPDHPNSKVNACADRIFSYYQEGQADKLTQLVFCDLSTPKNDGAFNVYSDLRQKLIAKGIPAQEICFIHEAANTKQKEALFSRVRQGEVRVLMGSTGKMGTGTNVQDRLCAIHNLDCPYRPSDLEQRAGRGLRRGNRNAVIDVLYYLSEGTFDAYMYQLMTVKQRFISQVFTNSDPARIVTDLDERTLSYAEIMALSTGDPRIMEKVTLEAEISRLRILRSRHYEEQHHLDVLARHTLSPLIESTEDSNRQLQKELQTVSRFPKQDAKGNLMSLFIGGVSYTKQAEAGEALLSKLEALQLNAGWTVLGTLRGFTIKGARLCQNDIDSPETALPKLALCGVMHHNIDYISNGKGIMRRLQAFLDHGLSEKLKAGEKALQQHRQAYLHAQAALGTPFCHQAELDQKQARLLALEEELNLSHQEQTQQGPQNTPGLPRTRSLSSIIHVAQKQSSSLTPGTFKACDTPEYERE